MRTWIVAGAVFLVLLSVPIAVEYRLAHPNVPPSIQRSECLTPSPQGQTGSDEFIRQGGRHIASGSVHWEGNGYVTSDIAQGRDLSRYDRLQLRDSEHFHPWERWRNTTLAQARSFVWQHWHDRERAYLILTLSSVDHTGTSHVFVEPDDSGRWRVFWRRLDGRELIDVPTAYSVEWITRDDLNKPGAPLPDGQAPDPLMNELQLRDVCGEVDVYL